MQFLGELAKRTIDAEGATAACGTVDQAKLVQLLMSPYFVFLLLRKEKGGGEEELAC